MNRNRMLQKRTLVFSLCAVLALLCAACRDPKETPVSSPAPKAVVTQAAATQAAATPEPVMLFGEAIPKSAECIEIRMPVDSLAPIEEAIAKLPQLREAVFCFPADWTDDPEGFLAYLAFRGAHPGLTFTEQYPEGAAPAEIAELTVARPFDALHDFLRQFSALSTVTLPSGLSREAIVSAVEAFPAVRFLWTDEVFGASDSAVRELTVSGDPSLDELRAYLACLPALASVDLRACALSEADGNALCDDFPAIAFGRTVTLNGVPTDTGITEYNLDNAEIDCDALSEALRYFPALTHLEMNDCSLTNEQLAALRERYPEKGIVWTVHVRGRNIRTDAVAYSSKQLKDNTNRITSDNCDALRYCTDLIALDLGHNAITDLSWIEPLVNLQVLILADNRISDLTPLSNLKKLKYLELFMNYRLVDIEPLNGLSELLDCNLCFTHVADLTPLYACTKLERIWLVGAHVNEKDLQDIRQVFPNANIVYHETGGSTADGWREHPRYDAYIQMFRTNTPVAPFLP